MPNNTRIPVCPFFKDEKKKSISCEDVFRSFPSSGKKEHWMDMYCDEWDWMKCPYAVDLNAMYERIDKGADMETEQMKHKIEAMRKELRYKATLLGRADKRLEAKEKEIKDLRRKNKQLEGQKLAEYKRRRKAESDLNDYEKHESERYFKMAKLYEDRLAYLIETYCDSRLEENTVKEWAKGKEYALTFDSKSKDLVWVVSTREVKEDGKDTDIQNKAEK